MSEALGPDRRKVFVVHGRNAAARTGMFSFLRSLGLDPIEWSQAVHLTKKGSPYVGEVLDAAFAEAQAVVVLMTPDEVAYLRPEYSEADDDPEREPGPQARPNVMFEAGMALGRDPDQTIVVELGALRPFSDIAGRHTVRLDNSAEKRKALAQRLETAGCAVDMTGDDWLNAGDLTPPSVGSLAPPAAEAQADEVRITAEHEDYGSGRGRLVLRNAGSVDLHDVEIKLPPEAGSGFHVVAEVVPRLPAGQSVGFPTAQGFGTGSPYFDLLVTAQTRDGDPVSARVFVSLS